jgi:hypothetical protein
MYLLLDSMESTMLEKHISDASKQSLVTQKTHVTYVASVM